MQSEEEYKVRAKVKSTVIKQIFRDVTRVFRGAESFFLICLPNEIQLDFRTASNEILIAVILRPSAFLNYDFVRGQEGSNIHKYLLRDFGIIKHIFQTCKTVLDLEIKKEQLTLSYTTTSMTQFIAFSVQAYQNQYIPEVIASSHNSNLTLKINKVVLLTEVIHHASTCKLIDLSFIYNSLTKKLVISDCQGLSGLTWKVKVTQINNGLSGRFRFSLKMLKCAVGLLGNDNELILVFYDNYILFDSPQKQCSFSIKINAKINQN